MGAFDVIRRQTYQRLISDEARKKSIKKAIIQLAAEGKDIDGVLIIFLKKDKIYAMEGGLNDDFEAQALMQRVQYLINRDGLVKP